MRRRIIWRVAEDEVERALGAGQETHGVLPQNLLLEPQRLQVTLDRRDPRAVAAETQSCDHVHLPPPETLEGATRWREMAGLALRQGAWIGGAASSLIALSATAQSGYAGSYRATPATVTGS